MNNSIVLITKLSGKQIKAHAKDKKRPLDRYINENAEVLVPYCVQSITEVRHNCASGGCI